MTRRSRTTGAHCAGCSKSASSKAAASKEAIGVRYVELLSEARTLLADFFSILLVAYVGRVEYMRTVGRTHVVMSGNRR